MTDREQPLEFFANLKGLSPRLQEIFISLARGQTTSEVCESARVSENTMKTEIRLLLRRLEIGHTRDIHLAGVSLSCLAEAGLDEVELRHFLECHFLRIQHEWRSADQSKQEFHPWG